MFLVLAILTVRTEKRCFRDEKMTKLNMNKFGILSPINT